MRNVHYTVPGPPTQVDNTTLVGSVRPRYGGHSGGETPGPIPNPEAKPSSADGTAPARVWESRTPPNTLRRRGTPPGVPLLSFACSTIRTPTRGELLVRMGLSSPTGATDGVRSCHEYGPV